MRKIRIPKVSKQPPNSEEWRLVKVGEVGPRHGGHGSWVETDHPAVKACMGSVLACAANGCQARVLMEKVAALPPGPQESMGQPTVYLSDVMALLNDMRTP